MHLRPSIWSYADLRLFRLRGFVRTLCHSSTYLLLGCALAFETGAMNQKLAHAFKLFALSLFCHTYYFPVTSCWICCRISYWIPYWHLAVFIVSSSKPRVMGIWVPILSYSKKTFWMVGLTDAPNTIFLKTRGSSNDWMYSATRWPDELGTKICFYLHFCFVKPILQTIEQRTADRSVMCVRTCRVCGLRTRPLQKSAAPDKADTARLSTCVNQKGAFTDWLSWSSRQSTDTAVAATVGLWWCCLVLQIEVVVMVAVMIASVLLPLLLLLLLRWMVVGLVRQWMVFSSLVWQRRASQAHTTEKLRHSNGTKSIGRFEKNRNLDTHWMHCRTGSTAPLLSHERQMLLVVCLCVRVLSKQTLVASSARVVLFRSIDWWTDHSQARTWICEIRLEGPNGPSVKWTASRSASLQSTLFVVLSVCQTDPIAVTPLSAKGRNDASLNLATKILSLGSCTIHTIARELGWVFSKREKRKGH